MKAWVLEGKRKLVMHEIAKPAAESDEIVVKITTIGLCGSDIEIYLGNRKFEAPMELPVLGHEAMGVVEDCGSDVTGFEEGDSVVLRGVWGCCAEYVKATVISPPNPCGARFIQVIKIPNILHTEGISLLEVLPKIILAVDRADITPAHDVLVIGQGVTGLLLTQVVNLKSPHRLVVIDLFEEKLKLARKFGATHTLCRESCDIERKLLDILPNGADVVFPCHLAGEGVVEAVELLKWRGKVILWGCLGTTQMDFFQIHARGVDILATQMDNVAQDIKYCNIAVDYIQKGIVKVQELTTHILNFEETPQAFKLKETPCGNVVHVLVKVGE